MTITVDFRARNFSSILRLPLRYQVERFSWSVYGGPKLATIHADGPDLDVWELFERLRCPVTIYSDTGRALWWGYVHEVQVRIGQVEASVNLESMHNRIAVAYTAKAAGSTGSGQRTTTAWLQDDASVAEYGMRELLASSSGSTSAQALAEQASLLDMFRYPTPTTTIQPKGQNSGGHAATLTCRGWWSTLDWRYYSNLQTTATDTGAQVANILATSGQFFAAVDGITSGISVNQFRDGDGTALREALGIMKTGTANYRRLLARVDEHRRVQVYEEPALGPTPHIIQPDGRILLSNVEVPGETCPVGVWARMRDAIPGSVDTSRMADPSLVFIDESEYSASDGWLSITPRGRPTAADLMQTSDG